METHKSDVITSLCGRDAGGIYLVVSEDEKYVYVANGLERRADKPKKKNRAHVRYEGHYDGTLKEKLFLVGRLTNSEIRNALAQWAQSKNTD